ncbi:MAG TPA: ATP-binding protein [Gaiellaceae bacterium]|nr:ATP-binding protein [Gaiellaceae bacterium]
MRHTALDAVRRFSIRTWLVVAAAAAATGGTIAAVVVLEGQVRTSNAAEVRLVETKAQLNKLEWLPYEAMDTSQLARAQMNALEAEIRATVKELAAAPGAPDFTRLDGALQGNFAVLEQIYDWAIRDTHSLEELTPLGFQALSRLSAADAAFEELQRSYERAAHRAQTQAVAGSVAAIVLLLAGFSFFYLASARSRRLLLARQEELATALAELEEAQHVKDEFVGLVSHELRTPLTSICGFTELLLGDTANEEQREWLGIVERNGARLLHLVDDLLLTARIDSGRLDLESSEIDLATVVDDAVVAAAPAAEAASVRLAVQLEPAPLYGDPGRLGQVLDNLLSNAIKFTPAGGSVAVALAVGDGKAAVTVADTGMGIPADEREHVFERFYRSARARQSEVPGTGLGLAVTRGIVEAHGGTIGFESVDGQGTTFRVELPLARSREPVGAA